jgi:hypothetical protein
MVVTTAPAKTKNARPSRQEIAEARAHYNRRLDQLAIEAPILGARCPKALKRVLTFRIQEANSPYLGRIEEGNLATAAKEVYGHVQAELRNRRLSPLDRNTAFEIDAGMWLARRALIYRPGKTEAKRIEVGVAHGAPLTICMGPRRYHELKGVAPLEFADGSTLKPGVWLLGAGCYSIFPDRPTWTGGRVLWLSWCPNCKPETSHRDRGLMRAHSRVVEQFRSRQPR